MAPLAANEVAISPVAVLLCKTAVTARPARNAKKRARLPERARGAAEPKAQLGAEAPLDAGGDHVGAPEQEPNIAAELQQDQSAGHFEPVRTLAFAGYNTVLAEYGVG